MTGSGRKEGPTLFETHKESNVAKIRAMRAARNFDVIVAHFIGVMIEILSAIRC